MTRCDRCETRDCDDSDCNCRCHKNDEDDFDADELGLDPEEEFE